MLCHLVVINLMHIPNEYIRHITNLTRRADVVNIAEIIPKIKHETSLGLLFSFPRCELEAFFLERFCLGNVGICH